MQVQAANGKRTAENFEPPRRFAETDLNHHGAWLLERLSRLYAHLNERQLAGYIASMISSNDFLFLFQPHSIALCQLERGSVLSPKPVIHAQYVLAHDPKDKAQVEEAAGFYSHIREWAKRLGAETVVLGDATDVPLEMIQAKLGRTFNRQVTWARV